MAICVSRFPDPNLKDCLIYVRLYNQVLTCYLPALKSHVVET